MFYLKTNKHYVKQHSCWQLKNDTRSGNKSCLNKFTYNSKDLHNSKFARLSTKLHQHHCTRTPEKKNCSVRRPFPWSKQTFINTCFCVSNLRFSLPKPDLFPVSPPRRQHQQHCIREMSHRRDKTTITTSSGAALCTMQIIYPIVFM